MIDAGVILALGTLIAFVLALLLMTKICQCAYDRNPNRTENSSDQRIFIIEENGHIITAVPDDQDSDIKKFNVKYSYENLAPPPYLKMMNILAESSYEIPPPYPIDIET